MTIWERLKTALTPLGLPLAQNVWIATTGEAQPDRYLTYRLISAPPAQHADDHQTQRRYLVQVTYYSRTGFSGMPDVAGGLTAAGFAAGPPHELPYNTATRHFGLAQDFEFVE